MPRSVPLGELNDHGGKMILFKKIANQEGASLDIGVALFPAEIICPSIMNISYKNWLLLKIQLLDLSPGF